MERPKPSGPYLRALTGNNECVAKDLYQVVYQIPIEKIYPNLNLDEVVTFALGISELRRTNPQFLRALAQQGKSYDLFSKLNELGFARLNRYKKLDSEHQQKMHAALNPYDRRLEERLARVHSSAMFRLKQSLGERIDVPIRPVDYIDETRRLLESFPTEYTPLPEKTPKQSQFSLF